MIVIVAFFVLLLLGIPISMVVLGASTLGVILYSGTPLQIDRASFSLAFPLRVSGR